MGAIFQTQRERVKEKMQKSTGCDMNEETTHTFIRTTPQPYDKIGYDRSGLSEQFPFHGVSDSNKQTQSK